MSTALDSVLTFCEHPRTEVRWRLRRDGSGCWARQCLICGSQAGAQLSAKSPEVQAISERVVFDETLRERYDRARQQHWQSKREADAAERDRQNREWWAWYNRYLQSPQWRERRRLVFSRARGMCEGCREETATQVHHLTYAHVGNEFLFELVAVCDECHERLHEKAER